MTLLHKGLEGRLDEIIDDCTIALTSRTQILPETADPAFGKPGDEIVVKSFDERVIDVFRLNAALTHLIEAYTEDRVVAELDRLIEWADNTNQPTFDALVTIINKHREDRLEQLKPKEE